ncbi:MAG: DUF5106 domain-containing protein [Bacteroidales bacterium]|nr:DUF5106 domain-containing protein [Bacteroidales bacterium]
MMTIRPGHILLAFSASVLLLSSCGGKGGKALSRRTFPPLPQVPSVLTGQSERGAYLADHFWDAFLSGSYPCDSFLVNGVPAEDVESALGRFVTIIETACDRPQAMRSMEGFFKKVNDFQTQNPSSGVYGFFEEKVAKYLFDPNSPVRDEDLYLPYLKGLLSSSLTPGERKPAYTRDAAMCSLNQVGTVAADISFTCLDGKKRTLRGINADHILLLFTNPGCQSCEEVISSLTASGRIGERVRTGSLAVVNLYIDLEVDKWIAMAKSYPETWINGYDQDHEIRTDLTYCVRAIPSMYVLDRDKRVVMKDAPAGKVIPFIENI